MNEWTKKVAPIRRRLVENYNNYFNRIRKAFHFFFWSTSLLLTPDLKVGEYMHKEQACVYNICNTIVMRI